MSMNARLPFSLAAVFLLLAAGPAQSGPDAFVPGQKLDSGLGDLPHYTKWADPTGRQPMSYRVLGESLDNGLGELPHYSKWVDPTGRDPLGLNRTQVSKR